MDQERPIPGFPGYFISNIGEIRSEKQGKSILLRPRSHNKYLIVNLWKDKKRHTRAVHRLVLEAFVGPCPEGMECRHLDGNPQNNRLENLRWGTVSENRRDMIRHGTIFGPHNLHQEGEKNPSAKLKESDIRIIRYLREVAKFKLADIAWQFDVCRVTISQICSRKRWSCA